MSEQTAEVYQQEQAAAYVAELQAKAQRHNEYLAFQAARVEAERIDGIADKIRHTISALYFAEQNVERLQREYSALDPLGWDDKRVKECLIAAQRQVKEFKAYLAAQSTPGQPYTAAEIAQEIARFAEVQQRPAKLAAQVAAAQKKIEQDAKPQPSEGKPQITYPCPRCGSALPSPGVAMHRNATTGWCVIDVRRAYASGRDQFWLISEGGVSVQELRDAGIAIPEQLLT